MRKRDVEALAQCNEAKRHLDELYNWTNADPKVHALLANLDEQLAFGNKAGQIYKMTSAKHWGTTERSSWTTHKRATPTLELFKGTFKEGAGGALAETATEDDAGVTNDGDAEIMATVLAITKRRDASKKARDAVIHELYRSEMQEGGWQLDDAMKNTTSEQVEAELAAAADPSRPLPKEAEAAVMPPWIVPDAEEEEGATAAVEDAVGAVAGGGKEGQEGGGGEEAEEEAAPAQQEEEVEAVSAALRLRGYTVSTFGAAPRAALSAALAKVLALGSGALVSVGGVTGSGGGAAAGGAPGATPDLSQRWKQRREAGLGVGGAGGGRGAPGTVTVVVEILIPVLGAVASARGAAAAAAAREAARARAASKAARVAAQLDAMSRAAADGGASRSADATFNTRLLAAFTASLEPEAAQPGAARQRAGAVPAGLAVAVLPSARPRTARSEAGGGAGPQDDEALARGWALLERVPTAAAEGGSGEGGGGEGDGPAADFVGDEDDVCSVASFRSLACEALRERNEKLSHHLRAAHPDRPPTARPATAGSSSSSSSSRRPRTPGALTAAAVGRMDGTQKRAVAAAVAGARRAARPGTAGSSAGPGASRRTRRVVGGTARRRAGNNGGGGFDAGSLTARSVNPFPEFDNKPVGRPGTARRAAAAPSSSAALVRPRTSSGGSEAGSARISGPLRGRMKVARQMLLECKPPSKRGHLDGVMFNIPGAPKGPKCFLTTKRVAERFDKEKRRDTSEHANDIEWNLKRNGETDYQDAKVKWIRQMGGMR